MKVIVVGAGGLTCAKASSEGGAESNLFLVGEYTGDSSIHGSMLSCEWAAREVLG
jgi:hypothetical protein